MTERRRVLLGTVNPSKQASLRKLLAPFPVEIVTPDEAGMEALALREDGWTFKDNAEYKARAYARASGMPSVASDGGLEIPTLRGRWEGLKSRRFAGPEDEDRVTALLKMLEGHPPESRAARFHEAVAMAEPSGRIVASAQASGPIGRIAEEADARTRPGFWLPSLWLYPPRWVTEWDLEPEEKEGLQTAWDAVAERLAPDLQRWVESTG
jgi:XTP/dITP diphosphohydrolase